MQLYTHKANVFNGNLVEPEMQYFMKTTNGNKCRERINENAIYLKLFMTRQTNGNYVINQVKIV